MATFDSLIEKAGKGRDDSREFIYLVDINFGGTIGTYSYGEKTREIEGTFFKGKLLKLNNITRKITPEKASYQVSGLNIGLANEDLEFSKYPYDSTLLDKKVRLRLGFDSIGLSEYETLFKGVIKNEKRAKKVFSLNVADYTHKINIPIPPRKVNLIDFPFVGTSVPVLGTNADAEDDIIGKEIPYIYGDFTNAPVLRPLFIDVPNNRYLLADHAIGTVVKVWVSGTQVFNFTPIVSGTHHGTKVLSFIDFGTSQGTKIPLIELKGKLDTGGTVIENPANIVRDFLTDSNLIGLNEATDIGTASFDISAHKLRSYKYRYLLNEHAEDSFHFIQEITKVSLANFFFDSKNEANFEVQRPVRVPSYKSITQKHIQKDSLDTSKDLRDVVNKITIFYDYDWYNDIYRKSYSQESNASKTFFDTTKELEIETELIYNDSEAQAFASWWLRRYKDSIHKVNFTVPISLLPLELTNFINFTHEEMPSGTGGWSSRVLHIVGMNVDNSKKRIKLKCYDAEEFKGKYFFLGDPAVHGTAWSSANSLSRTYGYLCGTKGLMSDTQTTGYSLW